MSSATRTEETERVRVQVVWNGSREAAVTVWRRGATDIEVGTGSVDLAADGPIYANLLQTLPEAVRSDTRELLNQIALSTEKHEADPPQQAQQLIALAEAAELFRSPDGTLYATIPVDTHRETHRIGQQGFRLWLIKRFYELVGKPPGHQAMESALDVLRAKAQYDGAEHPVHVRLARGSDGALYLDLANAEYQVVKVNAHGWELIQRPPVRFRRPRTMASLPVPIPGGSVGLLRPFVNVDHQGWTLLLALLVAMLWPSGPYPIVDIEGEQGSAKSSLARIIKLLVDPTVSPNRGSPRDQRDVMVSASNNHVLSFDNLSVIPDWLSDCLCRLSTGGGFSTRMLYTDGEEHVFDAMRPVIVNGIVNLVERDDFRDRAVILGLGTIDEGRRREEAVLWREFEEVRPKILGAVLDAVSTAIRTIDSVSLTRLPRMADFARLAVAAEPGLGLEKGSFLKAYGQNRASAVETNIEFDVVAREVRSLAARHPNNTWTGTATQLFEVLKQAVQSESSGPLPKDFPETARKLANRLKRATPALRAVGIDIRHGRTNTARIISITDVGTDGNDSSRPSPWSRGDAGPEDNAQRGMDSGSTPRRDNVEAVDRHGDELRRHWGDQPPRHRDDPETSARHLSYDGPVHGIRVRTAGSGDVRDDAPLSCPTPGMTDSEIERLAIETEGESL